jgi:GTPase
VGFIRDLPKSLLAAFRATLEEVQEAALILHVSDISDPHHDELDDEVQKILSELGVADRPMLRVLNKADRLTPEQATALNHSGQSHVSRAGNANHDGHANHDEGPVVVSALTGAGIDELLRRIDVALPTDPLVSLSLRLPMAEGRTLALIHAMGRVLKSKVEDEDMLLDAEVPVSIARSLRLSEFAIKGTSPLALT